MAQGYCAIEWSQTSSNSFSVSGDTNVFDFIMGKIYCNILINYLFLWYISIVILVILRL